MANGTTQPPIKNTSGEGFAVEDSVGAWLACHLLTGVPWPSERDGVIQSIACQMRQDGWEFDDFVVELNQGGVMRKCGCSVKSFTICGKKGASAEFAAAAWRQWLGADFQRGQDMLAIIAAAHPPDIREAWHGLLDAARVTAPEILAKRQTEGTEPSALRRSAFVSMHCPSGLNPAASADSTETARLLGSLRLQEHDFDHTNSQSVTQTVLLCQQALADSARSRAVELWEAMLVYASQVRRKGGRITLPDLLAQLVSRFPLKQHPEYAADWVTIRTESTQKLSVLPTKIGGSVAVHRPQLIESINAAVAKQQPVVLLGDSGNGKTVLAHAWATADTNVSVVWLRAGDLSAPGGLRALWTLRHSVAELCASTTEPTRFVLDGLDKCFDEAAFSEAAILLNSVLAPVARDRWQVVLTCCPNDWERVRRHLIRCNVQLHCETVTVDQFSEEELLRVCEQKQSLKPLWQRPHLRLLLRWPKALDIAATHWQSSDAPPEWTSESDFARWFWQTAICRDEIAGSRDRAARKLAVLLADRFVAVARLDDFTAEEVAVLTELARERHVEVDGLSQTVRFTHELIADWARLRELQVQGASVPAFLKPRLHSPFWHRALRFLGLDLLEQHADSTDWVRLFREFSGKNATDEMAQNLLLEAPVFALRQRAALDRLWAVLSANKGALLRRFLRQFLRVATIADERMVALFREKDPDLQLDAASLYRLPWVPYWLGVLAFLDAHCADVVVLAREEVADLCLLWLPLHQIAPSAMKQAAKLAIESARQLYRSGEHRYTHPRTVSAEEKVCAALFAAAPVMPDEVAELSLKLSGRRLPDPNDGLPTEEPEPSSSHFLRALGPPVPWPEGPQRPCVPAFAEAFMNGNFVAPFFKALPDVATEVMFAVLLDIPRANENNRDEGAFDLDEHGFSGRGRGVDMSSCFWTNGPFLTFLRLCPDVALSAIIRLVNFATDRATELGHDAREPIEVPVTVDGQTRSWRGHRFSYLWHHGHVFGPRVMCCALLSLEKWLYLLMDAGEDIEAPIKTTLRESHSIALAAVLICLGKRKPELFLGPLRPLIAATDFYWLEEISRKLGEDDFGTTVILDRSKLILDAWREWAKMPHRKELIGELAFRKLLSDMEWRKMFDEFRPLWKARLAAGTPDQPAPGWLPRIVAQFDLTNWRAQHHQGQMLIAFQPPADFPQPTPEEAERFRRYEKLSLLPFECRRVLMGETACSEEQMASWWAELTAVREFVVPDEERGVRDVEDALCGIVAVAVVRHRAWLGADGARETQALEILREVLERPPAPPWFGEDNITDFKWDNFVAWAVTTLWTERPKDRFLRRAVGDLAFWYRDVVVERTMQVAAAQRARLGRDFEQLLSHAIRFAPARFCARMEHHRQQKTFDLAVWAEKRIKEFVSCQTPELPVSWAELIQLQPRQRQHDEGTTGFDVGRVNAALAWALDIKSARNDKERTVWLHLHREALLSALGRMHRRMKSHKGADDRYHDSQETSPYKDESELLRRVARIIAHLAPTEAHQTLWEPIFALGVAGHRWIEDFVSHWFIEAAGHDKPAPAFVEQWLAMLTYAENSPSWNATDRSFWHLWDTWKYVLGLRPFSFEFWHAELAPAVEAVRQHIERWAKQCANRDDEARVLIYFLMTKASIGLRLDGLTWLHETVRMDDSYFWNHDSTRDAFASFLRLLLDEHWSAVASSKKLRDAFIAFALKLAALQHPLGTEILYLAGNRLGSTV